MYIGSIYLNNMSEIVVISVEALKAILEDFKASIIAELKPEIKVVDPDDDKMWSVEDVMEYTGYSKNTVYRKRVLLGASSIGHKLLFVPSFVKDVLERNGFRRRK